MRKFLCNHIYTFQQIWPLDGNYFVKVCCAKCGKVTVKEELIPHRGNVETVGATFVVLNSRAERKVYG